MTPINQFAFTPTEQKIAAMIAQGKSLKRVGRELGKSHNTIRAHVKNIFAKTGTHHQSALAVVMILGELPR